jgi:dolichol-phosphate mannosyltransferase
LKIAFPIRGAKDYTCGYRLYSGRILRKAGEIYGENLVEEPNFVCMVEILIKLARTGASIGEVPLVLRYDLKAGASKMKIGRTIVRYLGLIRRYRILGELRKFDRCGRGRA